MKNKKNNEDFIWKIIQYDRKNGKQYKKRMGDTKIGFDLSLHRVRSRKYYYYKVFISPLNWKEI